LPLLSTFFRPVSHSFLCIAQENASLHGSRVQYILRLNGYHKRTLRLAGSIRDFTTGRIGILLEIVAPNKSFERTVPAQFCRLQQGQKLQRKDWDISVIIFYGCGTAASGSPSRVRSGRRSTPALAGNI
jgi:hypothetical protein